MYERVDVVGWKSFRRQKERFVERKFTGWKFVGTLKINKEN